MKSFLVMFALLGVLAFVYAETNCESHRRSAGTSGHGLKWNIECDNDGYYRPLQCTEDEPSKKWCACYNKDEAITGPSRSKRYCKCHLEADKKTNEKASDCEIPKCANTGKYQKEQCCGNQCRCVNPDTGANTNQSTGDRSLRCA